MTGSRSFRRNGQHHCSSIAEENQNLLVKRWAASTFSVFLLPFSAAGTLVGDAPCGHNAGTVIHPVFVPLGILMSIVRARDAEQKLLRKQSLLNAGWELFLAGDGQLPSVAQILARAGLAKGTFYIYFKTKEELFLELVTEAMDELSGQLMS